MNDELNTIFTIAKTKGKNQIFLQSSLLFTDEYLELLTKIITKMITVAIVLNRLFVEKRVEKYTINQYILDNIRKEKAIVGIISFFFPKSEMEIKNVGIVSDNNL